MEHKQLDDQNIYNLTKQCLTLLQWTFLHWQGGIFNVESGVHLNIKMSSYQYRDPHIKSKTVLRPSYL